MPDYDYICEKCETVTEEKRSVEDRDNLGECPSCGGDTHRDKIARTSFLLKGECWAKDNYGLKKS